MHFVQQNLSAVRTIDFREFLSACCTVSFTALQLLPQDSGPLDVIILWPQSRTWVSPPGVHASRCGFGYRGWNEGSGGIDGVSDDSVADLSFDTFAADFVALVLFNAFADDCLLPSFLG